MDDLPDIYHINGAFLVFNEGQMMKLRNQRIYGQLIGCAPKNPHQIVTSGYPCLLSQYAANIAYRKKLAKFKKLQSKNKICPERNANQFAEDLSKLKDQARKDFVERRVDELKKRNIEISESRLGQFSEKKMKMITEPVPVPESSSFDVVEIEETELKSLFKVPEDKLTVYRDIYDKGFYISSGMKFGSDFLAYPGEPIRYHAQYAVKVLAGIDGKVDLNKINFTEINALQRLCHTANKIPLYTVLTSESEVRYWTLNGRQCIQSYSTADAFTKIELVSVR